MIAQGDVCWADLPDPVGSGPGFRRPVLVVQGDAFNRSRVASVVCIPLTSNLKWAEAPGNVRLPARSSGLFQGLCRQRLADRHARPGPPDGAGRPDLEEAAGARVCGVGRRARALNVHTAPRPQRAGYHRAPDRREALKAAGDTTDRDDTDGGLVFTNADGRRIAGEADQRSAYLDGHAFNLSNTRGRFWPGTAGHLSTRTNSKVPLPQT